MPELPPSTGPVRRLVTVADTQYIEQQVTRPQTLNVGDLTVTFGSSADASISGHTQVSLETERQFRALAERWYLDTMPLSSYVEKILHPSYQKILVLGKQAVPFIMDELEDMPNDWFWALRMLTDADPVPPTSAGNMQVMADAWLQWWQNEGPVWRRQNGL